MIEWFSDTLIDSSLQYNTDTYMRSPYRSTRGIELYALFQDLTLTVSTIKYLSIQLLTGAGINVEEEIMQSDR